MFVADIARDAVAGRLQFRFTRLDLITCVNNSLHSVKGIGPVSVVDEWFELRFTLQCKDHTLINRLLNPSPDSDDLQIRIEGVEKNGAVWRAPILASMITLSDTLDTLLIRVPEWQRHVERGGQDALIKTFIPMYLDYPGHAVNTENGLVRTAMTRVGDWRFELNNHGDYTEILTFNSSAPQTADIALAVLQRMLNCALHWVYREAHDMGRRTVTVRPKLNAARADSAGSSGLLSLAPDEFWRHFSDEMTRQLEQVG